MGFAVNQPSNPAMPIYAYRCDTCGYQKEVLRKLSDPLLSVCPSCQAETFRKQLTAAGFQLKGSGWYVTDFRGDKASRKGDGVEKANGDEKGDGKGDANGKPAEAAPAASDGAGKAAPAPAGKSAEAAPSPAATPSPSTVPSGSGSGSGTKSD